MTNKKRGAPKTSGLTRAEQLRQGARSTRESKEAEGLVNRKYWVLPEVDMALSKLKTAHSLKDKGAVLEAILSGNIGSAECRDALKQALEEYEDLDLE